MDTKQVFCFLVVKQFRGSSLLWTNISSQLNALDRLKTIHPHETVSSHQGHLVCLFVHNVWKWNDQQWNCYLSWRQKARMQHLWGWQIVASSSLQLSPVKSVVTQAPIFWFFFIQFCAFLQRIHSKSEYPTLPTLRVTVPYGPWEGGKTIASSPGQVNIVFIFCLF